MLPALMALFLLCVIVFYAVIGGDARFEVHDDLDLFPPQYLLLKQTGTFFAHDVNVPFLGGIDRDYLPSEFSLTALCYMLLPGLAVHVALYVLKVVIATGSAYLLARELLLNGTILTATNPTDGRTVQANGKTRVMIFDDLRDRVLLCGFAYGLLNLYPHFGIAFASIPLVVYLLLKIHRSGSVKAAKWWYVALFLYPFVSYFSYFGFFILCYLAAVLAILAIRQVRKKGNRERTRMQTGTAPSPLWPLAVALVVLCAGYVVLEYRLFRIMLFSDIPSIREVMGQTDISFAAALGEAWKLFLNGQMHTTSVHKYVVIPVCVTYIAIISIRYNVNKRVDGGTGRAGLPVQARLFLALLALTVLNAFIGGLGMYRPFRTAVEELIPVLKGFQFNRTYFFNPFLWYAMLCVAVCDMEKRAGTVFATIACAVALTVSVPYNSLFYSAYEQYYRMRHDGQSTGNLTYGDFFATELFARAKEAVGYEPSDYAVAYGFYPAVLQYNGISTLDGYLGYYPLAYKDLFRAVIAPELELDEEARDYFDRFGARCYLQPGPLHTGDMQFRTADLDTHLYIDPDALRRGLGCRYLFSRVEVENAEAIGMRLLEAYEEDSLPYCLYVYLLE